MFIARDTADDRLWFRLRDCAAHFGSLFCLGWKNLDSLVRSDVSFLPGGRTPRDPFDQALVRDLGLVVLAEWNDPDVWLWMQSEDPAPVPRLLDEVYGLVKEPCVTYRGVLAGRAFAPSPEGWKCSRCGRFPSQMSLRDRIDGVPLYMCSGREETACLTS
ncbi:hypothetical protein OOK29_05765 [Streptomyces phaeochromogenes]|uniref:Uncharacterized protein n=1 Tax=Streptomyces phaeochromogenes TaxID=1923 RepID=A0ABZ1HN72_STRPH|nr:hypothetical protein [Streptomyces phaeochromogenes]MCX5597643.1 hypothetical protein [Streptomyces phaeochromogenes]WSD18589.1 hypothetical protein OHB35_38135 [Streptomyces phaeochromogenes]